MKIPEFLKLSAKQSRASGVMLQGLKMPGPIDHLPYGQMSRESYERNIPVYLCVNLIAQSGCGVPWFLQQKGTSATAKLKPIMSRKTAYKSLMYRGARRAAILKKVTEKTEVTDHPALTLLEQPNPYESQAEYMLKLISFFCLSGNSYEEFNAPNRKDAPPQEMYTLRPDRCSVIPNTAKNRVEYPDLAAVVDETAWILGYLYTVTGRPEDGAPFAPSAVLHRKFFHPTNDFYGLSPLQVAARHYRTDNLSADWNYALLKNQARPSGALVSAVSMDDPTYLRLKGELRENYSGGNVGMPMLLEGGLDWKAFGLSPLEMDWLAGTRDARAQVASVFHIPPEKIGDPEHRTYNSMPEATRAMWMEAVLPILDAIRDSYNSRLIPLFGDGLLLDYDRDQIDALAEDQAKVWERVDKTTSLTLNEKREAIGYDEFTGDPEEDPAADVPAALLKVQAPAMTAPPVDGVAPKPPVPPVNDDGTPGKFAPVREAKAQRLTTAQKGARAKLRRAISDHFKEQGSELARYLKSEISKL
jgi:HK97 family phage portal protein